MKVLGQILNLPATSPLTTEELNPSPELQKAKQAPLVSWHWKQKRFVLTKVEVKTPS